MNRIIVLLFILLHITVLHAQQFNANEQYKQAMQNAKLAMASNQYSQAVMFYREALSIKPNELLPKYKIEDIRTIYIKNELDSLKTNIKPIVAENKKKKELIAEEKLLEQKAEAIASAKMNKEAEIAKQELKQLVIEPEVLIIDDSVEIIEDVIVENTQPDRMVAYNKIEKKELNQIKLDKNNDTILITEKRPLHAVKEIPIEEKTEPEIKQEPKVEIAKTTVQKVNTPAKPEITEEWINNENKKLLVKYPNEKTIEEIEKPGKHITRVIININQKVTVYLKVKHGWGATYFFIDELGLELRSISENHFNTMTDLGTYRNN